MATYHMHPFDTSLHDLPTRPSFLSQRRALPALEPAWDQTSPLSYEFDFPPSISQRGPNPLFKRSFAPLGRQPRAPLTGYGTSRQYRPTDVDRLRADRENNAQERTSRKTFDRTRDWAEEVAKKGARPAHRYTLSTGGELRRSRSNSSDVSVTPAMIRLRKEAEEREKGRIALERAIAATPVQRNEDEDEEAEGMATPASQRNDRVGEGETDGTFSVLVHDPDHFCTPASTLPVDGLDSPREERAALDIPALLSIPDLPIDRAPSPIKPISTIDRSTGQISPLRLLPPSPIIPADDILESAPSSPIVALPSPVLPTLPSPIVASPLAKAPILSIEDIIKQQSVAVDNALTTAKIKARKELRMAIPEKLKLRTFEPPAPITTDVAPPPVSSKEEVSASSTPPKPDTLSAASSAKETLSAPGSASAVSFDLTRSQTSSTGSASTDTPSKTTHRSNTPESIPASSEELHAIAKYLRSPHLHLSIKVPRPYPQEPVNVSFADVGSPTGKPVILYLGLGGVRQLAAALETLAIGCGLRLIAIDRWGLGKTEMIGAMDRGVMEWTSITNRVLQYLKIKGKVQILAHSAGAPYAMAFAKRWPERVKGKVHLLAPWVSSDLNDAYKWVKWVPDGVIKVSTKVEHMREGRKFGKAPTLQHKPVEYLKVDPAAEAHRSVYETPTKQSKMGRRASKVFHRQSSTPKMSWTGKFGASTDTLPLGRSPKMNDLKTIAALRTWSDLSTPPSSTSANSSATSQAIQTPRVSQSELDFGLSGGFETFSADLALSLPGSDGSMPRKMPPPRSSLSISHSSSSREGAISPSPLRTAATSGSRATTPNPKMSDRPPPPPTTSTFLDALRQAAHAEAQPGTTADLMLILQKSDTKPWGFKYTDIESQLVVWWGSEDDKIGRRAMEWMKDQCRAELKVVPNVGHDLLSMENVMVEVFDSLRRESWLEAGIEDEEYREWYYQ